MVPVGGPEASGNAQGPPGNATGVFASDPAAAANLGGSLPGPSASGVPQGTPAGLSNPEALITSLIASRKGEPVPAADSLEPPANASSMPQIRDSARPCQAAVPAAALDLGQDGVEVSPDTPQTAEAAARKAKLLADLVPQAMKQMQQPGAPLRNSEDDAPPHLHMGLTLQPKDLLPADDDDASPSGQAAGPQALDNGSQSLHTERLLTSDQPLPAADDEDPPISDVDSDATHSLQEDDNDMDIDDGILDAARKGAKVKARNTVSLAAVCPPMHSAPLGPHRRNGLSSLDADSAYTSIMALLKEKRGTVPRRPEVPSHLPAGDPQATTAYNLIAGLLRDKTDPAEVCYCAQLVATCMPLNIQSPDRLKPATGSCHAGAFLISA